MCLSDENYRFLTMPVFVDICPILKKFTQDIWTTDKSLKYLTWFTYTAVNWVLEHN